LGRRYRRHRFHPSRTDPHARFRPCGVTGIHRARRGDRAIRPYSRAGRWPHRRRILRRNGGSAGDRGADDQPGPAPAGGVMDTAFMRRLGPWVAVLAWIFGILLVLMLVVHAHFGEALSGFFNSAFGGRNLAYLMATLSRTTLIVGMALSSMFSFRAGLFNIGGEGQLVAGGMVAALVGVYLPGWGPLVLVCGILAGMAAGAAWALL